MTIVTLEDKTNELLKRREVKCLFKGFAGKLTRKEAVQMLAKELKLDKKFVLPISLMCKTGMNDINCTVYVYDDEYLAKKHLPKYIFMRMLTKEERKKEKEVEKAKRRKPSEGAPAEAKEVLEEKAKEEAKVGAETEAKVGAETEAKEKMKVGGKPAKSKKEAEERDKPELEVKE